jgi:O-antigen/teichoic acid export membrane protein
MTVANPGELVTAETDRDRTQSRFSPARIYSATLVTELLVMLVQIAVYKLVATWLGQAGFSQYALARRVLAFLQPLTLLGLGMALPRYLALTEGRGEASRSARYFCAALLWAGGFTVLLAATLLIWPRWFSYLFFGGTAYRSLIAPMALMLVGMSLHCILYAFLRGKMAVGRANALQLIDNGLLPLLVLGLVHKDVAGMLWALGFGWTATAGTMCLITVVMLGWENPVSEGRELLRYGLQRVPGDFALIALLALPAFFAAHVGGIQQAGFVAFGLSLVNMIASVFSPVGIILLPKVSRAIGSGDFKSVRSEIVFIRRSALLISGAMVLLFEVLGAHLIRIYLGEAYVAAQGVVKVLALGGLPLAFYSALRSVIDAFHHRAINTINLLVALALFLMGSGVGALWGDSQFVLWSFSAALTVLALLTQREVQEILKITTVR